MPKADGQIIPTRVQFYLMEYLAYSAMRQLDEVRSVLGLSVDTSHEDLISALRALLRGGQTVLVESDQLVGMQGGHTL